MFEERVDLSNNMTWRQMIGVGVRNVVLARGELDRLEGPGYAARRTELRKAKEAARTRDRQAAASQDEAEESVPRVLVREKSNECMRTTAGPKSYDTMSGPRPRTRAQGGLVRTSLPA